MDTTLPIPTPGPRPRVFVVSGVELVCEGLHLQLGGRNEIDLVGRGRLDAGSATAMVEACADVLVLDVGSTGAGAFATSLRDDGIRARIVGIAIGSTRRDIADWAELGVAGFVDDQGSIDDVVAAIRRVARGEFSSSPRTTAALVSSLIERVERGRLPEGVRRLTPRETQILFDLERGATNKEIARRLGISAATVKNHVHHLLEKLEVRRRQDAGALVRSGRI